MQFAWLVRPRSRHIKAHGVPRHLGSDGARDVAAGRQRAPHATDTNFQDTDFHIIIILFVLLFIVSYVLYSTLVDALKQR